MNVRLIATAAAFAAAAALVPALPAAAQALRPAPQLGTARPAPALSAAPATPQPADYIVAVVNSEPITNNEVRSGMLRFEQQLAQRGAAMPPREELARQVLDRLISEKAQLQLARETGIKADASTVDQAELSVARQNQIDVPELRRRLAADGIALATFRDDLRNQVLLTRLREREVEPRVRVSDRELDDFLREQQATGGNAAPLEIHLAHILVATPENASEAQLATLRAKALRAQERARAGDDFARLARELSDAPNAATDGGQMGMRPPDRYPALFVEGVAGLPEGGVSGVLRSGAGFHVLKVIEKNQGGLAATSVRQSRARHILLRPNPRLTEAAARAQLADYKRRILAGQADFAQLAREHSQDASAGNGGDLGWSTDGMFVPEFEAVMNALAPGQIGDPLVSRFGVHLIQLVERRQAPLSQREQRELARGMVREKKLEEAYAQWSQDVRGRAYVELREPPR
jgi:peptidyl-prolyl cis-trans isomerase SurA